MTKRGYVTVAVSEGLGKEGSAPVHCTIKKKWRIGRSWNGQGRFQDPIFWAAPAGADQRFTVAGMALDNRSKWSLGGIPRGRRLEGHGPQSITTVENCARTDHSERSGLSLNDRVLLGDRRKAPTPGPRRQVRWILCSRGIGRRKSANRRSWCDD
jgi:hypothetical protein